MVLYTNTISKLTKRHLPANLLEAIILPEKGELWSLEEAGVTM
jgi:hypothetical protein